jgi:hypothetical protein
MARRPPARHPGRGSWEVGYPDVRYPGGWYLDEADEHGNRAGGGHRTRHRRDTTSGAAGNERLTAVTGMVLLALFAAEGVTILSVRRLLTLHFFFGMLLIGPVVLKACSTIYRSCAITAEPPITGGRGLLLRCSACWGPSCCSRRCR